MPDRYNNFLELSKYENGNYEIEYEDRVSNISIIAPHGGKIELNTTDIAKGIAEDKYNFYAFNGGKPSNNRDLHITSHNFDEPKCLELISRSKIVIAIHGCRDDYATSEDKKEIFIGGLDFVLRKEILKFLKDSNFKASIDENFKGENEKNICNLGKTKKGLQFELTQSFRKDKVLRDRFIAEISNFLSHRN